MNQNDLRVIKTEQLIKQAFYDLLKDNTFNKITISDIAGKARINRATFYMHYQDKFDLLSNLENEVMEDMTTIILPVTRESILACKKTGLPIPHIVKLLSYIEDNHQPFFYLLANDNIGLSFYEKMSEKFHKKVFEMLPELNSDEIFKKYFRNIEISIVSSIINQWVKTNMKESKDEIASLITKMIFAYL
ncbi:MAG: TetR family transcriptional regulator [Hungatella sp.]|nr:TetR family transcriptional regulator [Hungatella sp.]